MPDASTQTRRGKKIHLIKPKPQEEPKCDDSDDDEEEDICYKCKTDEEPVYQCMECDKYLCVECDPNEMATYGEGHSCSTMCEPCGEAYIKTFIHCVDCDYSISRVAFDWGKGIVMYNDLPEGGYRCGNCDDRGEYDSDE